jgi:nucleotide-binding universal stress UspA family protein
MRILVASDGSGPSDSAIRLAGSLAAKTGSELHVLHVSLISRYIYPDFLSDSQVERIRLEGEQRLAAEEARAREVGVEIAQSHLRLGRVDHEILALAEELRVGMIVIGNRSGEALSRILLGNDAESVVRHAHCAVLVVRDPADD